MEGYPRYYELLLEGKLQQAKKSCLESIEKCDSFETEKYYKMGLCHILNELKDYSQSEYILTELLKKESDFRVLHNLGEVKRRKGEFREALDIFKQEAELNDSSPLSLSNNCYELAKTKHMLNLIDEAFFHAFECFRHTQKTDDLIAHGCAYRILGDLFSEKSTDIAKSFFQQARNCFEKACDTVAIADIEARITCLQQGQSPKFIS